MAEALTVAEVRHTIFIRSDGFCEQCGAPIVEKTCHMHERKWRGRGGKVSVENSIMICAKCHLYEHRSRNPRWSKRAAN